MCMPKHAPKNTKTKIIFRKGTLNTFMVNEKKKEKKRKQYRIIFKY